MKLPGFTAEASLYQTSKPYQINKIGVIFTTQVVPAIPCCSACDDACDLCYDCLAGPHPNSCGGICRWCHNCSGHCSLRC